MFLASRTVSQRSVQALTRWTGAAVCALPASDLAPCVAVVSNISCLEPCSATQESMALLGSASKSEKRKAAEALLQSKFQSPDSGDRDTQHPAKRRHFSSSAYVAACSFHSSHPVDSQSRNVIGWCDVDVSLPDINWNAVATARVQEVDNTSSPERIRLPKYQLPYGLEIYLVERPQQMQEALRLLKDSMQDSIVSIDLEWKPDFVKDTSKVALMQLSSATCCLLIRTCKLQHVLPPALCEFLRYAMMVLCILQAPCQTPFCYFISG